VTLAERWGGDVAGGVRDGRIAQGSASRERREKRGGEKKLEGCEELRCRLVCWEVKTKPGFSIFVEKKLLMGTYSRPYLLGASLVLPLSADDEI